MSTQSSQVSGALDAEYWNSPAVRPWIDHQERNDAFLRPVLERLIAAADAKPGHYVVDIGCGCGATTLELAARVGPEGEVLGIDVSEAMVKRARELAPEELPARFIYADAMTYGLPPGEIDVVASQFGVMFFADPVQAFTNLRAGMKAGGRLVFASWREAKANEWVVVPMRAARKHAPALPETSPETPGPFAFADGSRVQRILSEAGFVDIDLSEHDLVLDVATGQGLDAAVTGALTIGPTARLLRDVPDATREAAVGEIRAAFEGYADGDRVPLGAAVWIVTARNPAAS
jgi:SAM-dependent methyltransferase